MYLLSKIRETILCLKAGRVTLPYPANPRPVPERFRGRPLFHPDKCIGCAGCANNCPAREILIADQCQEHGVSHLRQLSIQVDGMGKQVAADMRAISLALPQFGKVRFTIAQDMVASFGQGAAAESFKQEFRGGWDRFKRIKGLSEAISQEASDLKATLRVAMEFDPGLEPGGQQFQAMRDVLQNLGIGKLTVEAVPAQS